MKQTSPKDTLGDGNGMSNTTYIRYRWDHNFEDDPVELWSELDEHRFELRKLEYFRDGSVGYADQLESSSRTQLGDQPVPHNAEIIAGGEFEELDVSEAAFEKRWKRRMKKRPMG
jgi:hypothetical protein